jgi:acyl-CoA synthetase (NDP forming)
MIDACGARDVRAAMVVSSGFAEAGEEGRALQDELRDAALRHRIPLLGPNVEGFVNYVDRVAPYGTTPPPEPLAGGISVLSQSGTVAWTMNQLASDRGVGLRLILGVGNEAVLGLGDLFAWAAADPATKVVASYLETMRDVEGIGRGLRALRAARKPVVICAPAGRSEAARRSIVAHTGALAGDTDLRDAWLRGQGAVLVEDPVAMFESAVLLSHARRLRTTGIAAALQSGGACTLFAEAAGAAGLELPAFGAATKRALRRALPSFASLNDPLDVTGQAAVETEMFEDALAALARDPSIGLIAFDAFPPRLAGEVPWAEPLLARVASLRRETGVVFASVAMSALGYGDEARVFVRRHDLPFLQGHRAATAAIRALVDHQEVRRRAVASRPPHPNRSKALRALRGAAGPIDEATAAAVLAWYGVRRPPERVARTPREAAVCASRLGFPVAVKALAPEVPHKAAIGGVRLTIRSERDAEDAAAGVLRAARRAGARAPRVLVQRMAEGSAVLVGAIADATYGPMLTMRPGGDEAEAGRAAFVPCPLTPAQAIAFVRERSASCGLDPARDDLAATARAVAAVARAMHDLRGRLVSLEANPLLVGRRGAVAVDALAEASGPA